jgi:hypothetical protein
VGPGGTAQIFQETLAPGRWAKDIRASELDAYLLFGQAPRHARCPAVPSGTSGGLTWHGWLCSRRQSSRLPGFESGASVRRRHTRRRGTRRRTDGLRGIAAAHERRGCLDVAPLVRRRCGVGRPGREVRRRPDDPDASFAITSGSPPPARPQRVRASPSVHLRVGRLRPSEGAPARVASAAGHRQAPTSLETQTSQTRRPDTVDLRVTLRNPDKLVHSAAA